MPELRATCRTCAARCVAVRAAMKKKENAARCVAVRVAVRAAMKKKETHCSHSANAAQGELCGEVRDGSRDRKRRGSGKEKTQ